MSHTNYNSMILIVDDSDMNRAILSEMIGDKYTILEAADGLEALALLQQRSSEISLVLLDIVMPVMNGYQILQAMNEQHWIEDIPVIMISEESSPSNIERAYDMGAADFIARPFDKSVVLRRVMNTLMLYEKQKKLADLVVSQIYEKEKTSSLLIGVLSHIVEFRNGESGLHVIHVQNLTETLLKTLVKISGKYDISNSQITMISHASALHDIGKITIPDEVLNKPGRLTNDEFEIMKTHSMAGAEMLSQLASYEDEPLIKTAYEICRWHHERFDGKGYPDGLVGDDIPISAQIVALADVYDALTSERVYKSAYSHETAINMICQGQCGCFNPLLLECLNVASDAVRGIKSGAIKQDIYDQLDDIAGEFFHRSELNSAKRAFAQFRHEKMVNQFFMSVTKEYFFQYTSSPSVLTLSPAGAKLLGVDEVVVNPFSEISPLSGAFDPEFHHKISQAARSSTPDEPEFELNCDLTINERVHHVKAVCRSTWFMDEIPKYTGVIGSVISGIDA